MPFSAAERPIGVARLKPDDSRDARPSGVRSTRPASQGALSDKAVLIPPGGLSTPTQPDNTASRPTIYGGIDEPEEIGRNRIPTAALPESLNPPTIEQKELVESREYVAARLLLIDLVRSDLFRTEGCNAISEELIDAIELFHMQELHGAQGRERHQKELTELAKFLRDVPELGADSRAIRLQREGLAELSDFVTDPFFCHAMWRRCQLKFKMDRSA